MSLSAIRTKVVPVSGNKKTGPIPVVYVGRATCPARCPFAADKDRSCFGSGFTIRRKWDDVDAGGLDLPVTLAELRRVVRRGSPWRWGIVGDLPSVDGTRIHAPTLKAFRRLGGDGWSYTHHDVEIPSNAAAVLETNGAGGFTVNASCDSIEQAKRVTLMGIPAVVVGPRDFSRPVVTDDGFIFTPCPAALPGSRVDCSRCNLCRSGAVGRASRRVVVVFPAHGGGKLTTMAESAGVRFDG